MNTFASFRRKPSDPKSVSSRGRKGSRPRLVLGDVLEARCLLTLTFAPGPSLTTGLNPRDVVAADFDGDGVIDLAVTNSSENSIGVFRGLGGGTFATQVAYGVDSFPQYLTAADFNGDGRIDLAASDFFGDAVNILYNSGDGGFGPYGSFATGVKPLGIVAADFNDDGNVDLATADQPGDVAILLGDRAGGFGAPILVPVGTRAETLEAADLDGDGHLDLVTTNFSSAMLGIVFGNGDGTFRPAIDLEAPGRSVGVAIADFDGDGDPDLASAGQVDSTVSVFLNDGAGNFGTPTDFVAGHANDLAAGDFDSDGIIDLVAANGDGGLTALRGLGNGRFATVVGFDAGGGPATTLVSADLDGDGDLDIASTSYVPQRLQVYFGSGTSLDANVVAIDGVGNFLRFNASTPEIVDSTLLSGIPVGEGILGIDFRPANNVLYGITNALRVVTIDPATARVTPGATLRTDPTDMTDPFEGFEGGFFDVDFNPVTDRLRLVSTTGQNLRIDVDTGLVISDERSTPATGAIVALAYTNSVLGATSTTLYDIGLAPNMLYIQDPPNDGTVTPVGPLNLGLLSGAIGFDIHSPTNTALALFTSAAPMIPSSLYSIDLATGNTSLIGPVDATQQVFMIAVVPSPILMFSESRYSVVEGQPVATIIITRGGDPSGIVGATITASSGTASAGQDFVQTVGTVQFVDGQTEATFTIPILEDSQFEFFPNETVNLALNDPFGGAFLGARSTAILSIIDDEPRTISVNDATARESDGSITFTVSLDARSGQTITAVVSTANGSAMAGSDFVAVNSFPVIFAPGVTSQTVTVNLLNDSLDEPTEQFSIVVSGAINGLIGKSQGVATILDNDSPVVATFVPIAAGENAAFNRFVAYFSDPDGFDGRFVAGTTDVPAAYTAMIDWGDGSVPVGGAVNYATGRLGVSGGHVYNQAGSYVAIVSILKNANVVTQVGGFAQVADGMIAGSIVPGAAPLEGSAFRDAPIATFTDFGGAQVPGSYVATIDWGDGSPISPGVVRLQDSSTNLAYPAGQAASPGLLTVLGSHTYNMPGAFTVSVVLQSQGGTVATASQGVTVAAASVFLSGALNPASDSGSSSSDAITNVRQPAFFGFASPGAIIRYFAQASGGSRFQIGQAVADASGGYSLTSQPLNDGSYTISAEATGSNGVSTASATILPDAARPSLVIDTVGPQLTDLTFNRLIGFVAFAFRDDRSGLDRSTVIDGSNYSLSQFNKRPGLFRVTNLTAPATSGPTDLQTVFLTINNGRNLTHGRFLFTARSGGIADVAGNGLDGEFFGTFPSGNDRPGGDFVASINAFHNLTRAPQPIGGFATPTTRGTRPTTTTFRPTRTRAIAARKAHAAQVARSAASAHSSPMAGRRVKFAQSQGSKPKAKV